MSWRGRIWKKRGSRLKRDVNDDLFSKIIRFGKIRCAKCGRVKNLECAHIMGRGNYATRFIFYPIKNAVPLCNFCHSWFDEHKIDALIWEEKKRVLDADEESFSFLVKKCGYSWDDLQKLYVWANNKSENQTYEIKKKAITLTLRAEIKRLEAL